MTDGLLVIDKPAGMTSHDVVNRVRRILGTRRVGHTGTLDPFATGVMVLVVGRATRLAQFLDKDEKEYNAAIRFGFETDTGDVTGDPKTDNPNSKLRIPDLEAVKAVLPDFRGEIRQVPPMYSAKKVSGKKLYESARKGIEVEREAVQVTITTLELVEPHVSDAADIVRIRVSCSAGTYIRTLAEDIGRELGTGAHLTELRRTRSGRFDLSHAATLDELAASEDPQALVLPMEMAVGHLAEFILPVERVGPTQNGLSTRVSDSTFTDGQNLRMLTPDRQLIAIGVYSVADGTVSPKIVLV